MMPQTGSRYSRILGHGSSAMALTVALLVSAPAFAQAVQSPSPNLQTPPDSAEPPLATGTPAQGPADAGANAVAVTDSEEIIVTGFRQSLGAALNVKRADVGLIDVIKAEDIADFPDLNLAESLQRIPGVAIDRDAGEGRQISVRGLGSDFTRVRVNGIEALATTGGTDSSGGANRSRGFDFNVFASELFNSLTVRKSASAEVEEGSLGATVDLQTARPFDYKGFVVSASGQVGYNDLSEKADPRGAFLISNTWADGRFGMLASVAFQKRRLLEEGFSSVRWDNGASSGGFCSPAGFDVDTATAGTQVNPATTATNCGAVSSLGAGPVRLPSSAAAIAAYNTASLPTNFHPRLPRYGRLTHDQERLGITGAIQWQPMDSTRVTLDLLYADLDSTRQEDFLEAISFSRSAAQGGKPQTSVVNAEYAADGDLAYGVFNGVDIRSEQRFDVLETKFFQRSLNIEHEFSDTFRASTLIGRATSDFNNPVQTTVTLDAPNVNGYSIDFRESSRQPEIIYPFDVTSTTGPLGIISSPTGALTGSEVRIRPQGADNKIDTARLDLAWDAMPDTLTLKAGGVYRKYKFDTFEFRRVNQSDTILALPAGSTLGSVTTLLEGFGKGLDLPDGTPTSWLVPNLNAFATAYNIYCNCLQSGAAGGPGDFTLSSITNGNARGNNRSVREEDRSLYAQADFQLPLGESTLRGNIGLRWVETDQVAAGYQAAGGGSLAVVGQKYDDWLPAANLSLDVTPEFIVRLAAAKVMARPQLGNLTPGGSINTTGSLTITSGNPLLKPFRANTLDASFEWYFAKDSLLSLGLFYKDIGTYIQNLRTSIPFNQTGLPLTLLPANFTGDEVFQVTAPVNSEGGPLKGFEISYQQPFTFLPGFLSGFGAILNYTYVKSKIDYIVSPTAGGTTRNDLVGLSPNAWNATLYYEDKKFSARVSTAYRGDYLQRVPGQNNNDVEGKNSTLNVDASVSYNLTENISLTAEGINLTDEFNDQFVGSDRNSPSVVHHTGRQYYVGARVKF